eukprot:COSAG01_NODE_65766_length_272_cov_0.751445_1_plen_36_part_01
MPPRIAARRLRICDKTSDAPVVDLLYFSDNLRLQDG